MKLFFLVKYLTLFYILVEPFYCSNVGTFCEFFGLFKKKQKAIKSFNHAQVSLNSINNFLFV